MAARAAAAPTGAAVIMPTMPAIVRRPRQRPPPSACAVMNPTDRNAEPVRGRDAHQVRGELGRVVEVVPAEQSDAARVCVDLDAGPQHSLERHEPDEGQRREQNEAEGQKAVPTRLAVATKPRAMRAPETETGTYSPAQSTRPPSRRGRRGARSAPWSRTQRPRGAGQSRPRRSRRTARCASRRTLLARTRSELIAALARVASCRRHTRASLSVGLHDREQVALAVLEPGRLTGGRGRDAIHRRELWRVVLLERHATAAQFGGLCRQVVDPPARDLVLDQPGAAG
jgi:hypothetical protein